MQVRDAIAGLSAVSVHLGLPSASRAALAARALKEPPVQVEVAVPDDLDAVASRVIDAFASGEDPSRSDMRLAPWCLWKGRRPLASHERALDGMVRHLRQGRRGAFRRAASAYVVDFPSDRARASRVAEALRALAPSFPGPWLKAAQEIHLFDPARAPRALAERALREGVSPTGTLAAIGIEGLAAEANLAEAAFLAGIDVLRTSDMAADKRLVMLKSWAERPNGTLVFGRHKAAVADALVMPVADQEIPKPARDRCLGFLLAHFEDPRLRPGNWVAMSSTAVVRRWLTEQSLRQFLDVVGKVAYDRQWVFRRAFWEAVHHKGLVSDAWVVFDAEGASLARRMFEDSAPFAQWERKPQQAGQACLLLRIGRGIVAEWSHDGACHVWHDAGARSAPPMHRRTYSASEVRPRAGVTDAGARTARIVHGHAATYVWQQRLADEIFAMTGTRLMQSDFRV